MGEPKTRPVRTSVKAFLDGVEDEQRRRDCRRLVQIMKEMTRSAPRMWGPSIVGFGTCHYKYASGREGDFFLTGFSPRQRDLTLYIMSGFTRHAALMKRLGKHRTGKSCLYVKRLSDLDESAPRTLIGESVSAVRQRWG